VSYVGAWDAIRKLFANLDEAKERGYTPGTFSFNSGTGRCPTCTGSGFEHVEMQFLSDVYLRCPDCDGKRYRPEILALDWRGKSVADVLEMTVSEALAFFADQSRARRAGAAGRRRPRIPAPRPAGADALRRRGPAPQARRLPGRGRPAGGQEAKKGAARR
jgi:excinuclease ABC subunit A